MPIVVLRNLAIQAISDRSTVWDCLVIGGGATGLGSAVEAASRGLRTLLVEKTDFAEGTSSRATKLAHGGVRYLAQGNISLVREALRERGLMLKNAPNLAHPLKLHFKIGTRHNHRRQMDNLLPHGRRLHQPY